MNRAPTANTEAVDTRLESFERPTRSRIRKAGDRLRRQLTAGRSIADVLRSQDNADDWRVVEAFQSMHLQPTTRVVVKLHVVAQALGVDPPTVRIKRPDRIIEKIARSATGLERLQDVGGCRLVVTDLAMQSEAVRRILEFPFEVIDIDDYVANRGTSPFDSTSPGPRGSGYRAVHVVHRVDEVLVETQVRTTAQHYWAVAAERAEQITGHPLKFGDGPADLLDYFRIASQMIALQERGQPVDTYLVEQLSELRKRVSRYYRREG